MLRVWRGVCEMIRQEPLLRSIVRHNDQPMRSRAVEKFDKHGKSSAVIGQAVSICHAMHTARRCQSQLLREPLMIEG